MRTHHQICQTPQVMVMESNPFDTSNTPDNAVKMWDYYCPTCYTKYMVCGICDPDENEKVGN